MRYLDLLARISARDSRDPEVRLRSELGEAAGTLPGVLTDAAFRDRLRALEGVEETGSSLPGGQQGASEATATDVGAALFRALFGASSVRAHLDAARHRASERRVGLRLRLQVEPPDLADLPWEYLYDDRERAFLARSATTTVVRYVDAGAAVAPLQVRGPLRILGVLTGLGRPEVDADRERERLDLAVANAAQAGAIRVTWLTGPTWRELQRALADGRWHILHFLGDGGFDEHRGQGFVVVSDDAGEPTRLSANALARILGDHEALRLAVLTGRGDRGRDSRHGFSRTAASVVRRGTPAVVSIPAVPNDRAAFEFYRAFYPGMAAGLAVDAALARARESVWSEMPDSIDWATPVLFSATEDGALFDLGAGAEPATAVGARSGDDHRGPREGRRAERAGSPPSDRQRPADRTGPSRAGPRAGGADRRGFASAREATTQPIARATPARPNALDDALVHGGYVPALIGAVLGALGALLSVPEWIKTDASASIADILGPTADSDAINEFLLLHGVWLGLWLGVVGGAAIVLRLFRVADAGRTTFLLALLALALGVLVVEPESKTIVFDTNVIGNFGPPVAGAVAACVLVARGVTRLARHGRL